MIKQGDFRFSKNNFHNILKNIRLKNHQKLLVLYVGTPPGKVRTVTSGHTFEAQKKSYAFLIDINTTHVFREI